MSSPAGRTVSLPASYPYGNGKSHIPLRRTPSKPSARTPEELLQQEARLIAKLEESERKRKDLIIQNERSLRINKEFEKKYLMATTKIEEIETELFEKNESLAKLTTASKNLFKEYDTLKNQYDTETGAMHRALTDASQWYKENKVLKRKTMLLDMDTVDEGVEDGDNQADNELESLRESVRQLSSEVAFLQTELNAAKLLEFETTEQNINLNQELENEREKSANLSKEIKQVQEQNEQLLRISNMMKRELEELKEADNNYRNNVVTLRKQSEDYKRERNVLAHQSTILLQRLNSDEGHNKILLLQEIEDLKRTLEDERNKYVEEINNLQEKVEDAEKNSHMEILEERLKLTESELQQAVDRAERAETLLRRPPPPPPPPPMDVAPPVPLRTKKMARSSVPEIAEALGVQRTDDNNKKLAVGVNDDIINQIKDGKFTLRKAKKETSKKERETPNAVSEMLNILGSLRRSPKKRISISSSFADVQL